MARPKIKADERKLKVTKKRSTEAQEKELRSFAPRKTVVRAVEAVGMILQEIEAARQRGDVVKVTKTDAGICLEITSRRTKPATPNAFPYGSADDPALLAEWTRLVHRIAVIRHDLRRDDSTVCERAYVTAPMVAVATGRTRRQVDRWAADGRFIPAHQIGNERLWAVNDLDRLLRGGRFFVQSVNDKGHAGEVAARAQEAVAAYEAEQRQEAAERVAVAARQSKAKQTV
jgi:predicted DNA-binding protein (UPF0251 family)